MRNALLKSHQFALLAAALFVLIAICVSCGSSPKKGGGTEPGKDPGKKTQEPVAKKEPGKKDPEKKEPGKGEPGKKDPEKKEEPEKFVENQPEFPEPEDDAYFREPEAESGEVFRVLITKGNYQVRQVGSRDYLRRKRDPNGDRAQVEIFRKFSDRYNFADLVFKGMLRVRLNPHNGEIEMIRFIPGKTPQAAQAARLFKNDLSRFAFSFPKNAVVVREFRVRFEWRIKRQEGLTDEEAKKRLLEFLKKQLRKY